MRWFESNNKPDQALYGKQQSRDKRRISSKKAAQNMGAQEETQGKEQEAEDKGYDRSQKKAGAGGAGGNTSAEVIQC